MQYCSNTSLANNEFITDSMTSIRKTDCHFLLNVITFTEQKVVLSPGAFTAILVKKKKKFTFSL